MYSFSVDRHRLPILLWLTVAALAGFVVARWTPARVIHLPDVTLIRIWFPFPMKTDSMVERLVLLEEIPGTAKLAGIRWTNPFLAEVWVREPEDLQGQKITVLWRSPTRLPLISKSSRVSFRRSVVPRLVEFSEVAPTIGPVLLRFNTPLDPASVKDNIRPGFNGRVEPVVDEATGPGPARESRFINYSRWRIIPERRLRHDSRYGISLSSGLSSLAAVRLSRAQEVTFWTPGPVRAVGMSPGNAEEDVPLYPEIIVKFDRELSGGTVRIEGVSGGRIRVRGLHLEFRPDTILMPNRTYTVTANGVSAQGEPSESVTFAFRTVDLGNSLWIAVDLAGEHTVSVYRGDKLIRWMIASGGKPETPTPPGTYQLYTRGHSFWSAKFGEGAYFYVQFMGDYLFHSVPFDESGVVKEAEHQKLGKPASHGCVRLSLADAKWFYDNVPDGTIVVIYQ